jgi:putative methyltransferase (TIGR04325 family)
MSARQTFPRTFTKEVQNSGNSSLPLFQSFADAVSACGPGYEDPILIDVVAEKTERLMRELASCPVHLDQETAYRLALIHSCIPSPNAAVIDVGGACGYYFHLYKRVFGAAGLNSWRVIETPSMVAAAKARRFDNSILTFEGSLDGLSNLTNEVPTLVLCSSVLQYFPSPAESLDALTSLNPANILVTRTPLSDYCARLISLQTSNLRDNGPGSPPESYSDRKVKYPVVFEPLETIKHTLERNSYTVNVMREREATLFFDGISVDSHYTLLARRSVEFMCE